MRINEEKYTVLDRAERLLFSHYDGWNVKDDEMTGYVDDDSIIDIVDDLCSEIDRLNEVIDEQKEYYENIINDYYKPKSAYEVYGVNEDVFH